VTAVKGNGAPTSGANSHHEGGVLVLKKTNQYAGPTAKFRVGKQRRGEQNHIAKLAPSNPYKPGESQKRGMKKERRESQRGRLQTWKKGSLGLPENPSAKKQNGGVAKRRFGEMVLRTYVENRGNETTKLLLG